jgi:hypothetical protein
MQTLDSSIFDLAPIPMWLEDYSDIKIQFDAWRAQGVEDLHAFLSEDLDRVRQCAHKIKSSQSINKHWIYLKQIHRNIYVAI